MTSVGGAEEQSPSQAEAQSLVDGLVDWKNSFHNLRLVSRWYNPGQWIHRHPELAAPGALDGYHHIEDWLYSDDGRSRFEQRVYEKGIMVSREVSGNDGKYLFSCKFNPYADIPASILIALIPRDYFPQKGWLHPFNHHMGLIPWTRVSKEFRFIRLTRTSSDGARRV